MIDISINLSEALAYMNGLQAALNAALTAKSQALADAIAANVRDNKLAGGVLEERTGRLRSSIESAVESSGSGVSASIFVGGDVPYAAIQEYGGVTKAHVIEALEGRALSFMFAGKQAFFAHVNHPGSVIPQRSYLRSAFDEAQGDIMDGMQDALGDALA